MMWYTIVVEFCDYVAREFAAQTTVTKLLASCTIAYLAVTAMLVEFAPGAGL